MDYTGGFVLPLAIGFGTAVVGTGSIVPAGSGTLTLTSANSSSPSTPIVIVLSPAVPSTSSTSWTNYVTGVVVEYMKDLAPSNLTLSLTISISGNVPLGSGLSSSASLEVAVGRFIEEVFAASDHADLLYTACARHPAIGISRAIRTQNAENTFCSSPCGIMDQFISSCGLPHSLLLIDCLSNTFKPVPMHGDDVSLIVANSNVTHSISGGEYPKRVVQCQTATEVVAKGSGVDTLRHCTMAHLEAKKGELDDVTYRRALHVIGENERTNKTVEALSRGDYATVGKLMTESHESLDKNFEVTCPELNILHKISLAYEGDGVLGARMTGGGFGGCVITLVKKGTEGKIMEWIENEYREKSGGVECKPFASTACEGATGGAL